MRTGTGVFIIIVLIILSILQAGCAKMCEAGGRSIGWFGQGLTGAGTFIVETSTTE